MRTKTPITVAHGDGDHCLMLEAIHGSAPRRANRNLANPSGSLLGAVPMLVHIGQPGVVERVHNAWLRTIEDGIHTYDIFTEGVSAGKVGAREFAQPAITRLGQKPKRLKPAEFARRAGGAAPAAAGSAGINIAMTESLRTFDGRPGYTLAQGQ